MNKKSSARQVAALALGDSRKNPVFLDDAINRRIKQGDLDGSEAALATRLANAVLQNGNFLDYYINHYSNTPIGKIQPQILDILRVGAVQILFFDKIPVHAAVDEAVKMTKSRHHKASGLVNAILRRLAEHKENLPEIQAEDRQAYLEIKYSHPRWFIERMEGLLGQVETEALLQANNSQPPIHAQVNGVKTKQEALVKSLEAQGISAVAHPYLDDCLLLEKAGDLRKLEAFTKGEFYVQDPAARFAVMALGPKPGQRILDCCAAPGGKSFACGIQMGNQGEILASDISGGKIRHITAGAQRLGLDIIRAEMQDAKSLNPEEIGSFDGVLVDAPCSGLGIIRKKPEIRHKTAQGVKDLPEIQLEILKSAAACVRPGGVLVYSTCTVLPEENTGVIEAFLKERAEFCREAFVLPGEIGVVPCGEINLYPHRHATDGFFIAKLRRAE